ncbi:MAG: glycosyltransferase family 39 protein [Alphaproteobacteria bacterium]|nr:glycosyltransferase family 39 protein [Alphaproteobacteria bacterium]
MAAALGLLTLLRLALAASLPLAPDEAYYWVWSRALAPAYFDHPPMIALWIRAGTWIAGDSALGVRLLGPISAALGSVLLWDAAERLLPGRRAGLLAAALMNATLLTGVGAVIATPDAPLLLFWTLGLWGMARIITRGSGAWWPAVGLFVGLAFASKYTAALFVLGIGIWLVAAGRKWLRRPEPYLGAALALATATPVFWWNAAHQWVSFVRQGGRTEAWSPDRAPQYLLELFAGQLGLATPLIFLLLVAGMTVAARSAWRRRDPVWCLLVVLSVVPALIFVQHALGDRVQANWPAIAYPAAAIAASGLSGGFWRRLQVPAIVLGLAMTAAVYVQAEFAPLRLPPEHDPIALQIRGWRNLAAAVEVARSRVGAGFVAADNYGVAAELARTLPRDVPVVAVGPRWSTFELPTAPGNAEVGLLVEPEDHAAPIWQAGQEIGRAARTENGKVIRVYRLYRATPDHSTSAVLLPHPEGDE